MLLGLRELLMFLGWGLVVVLMGGLGMCWWWRISFAVRRRPGSLRLGWVWVWGGGWGRAGRRRRWGLKMEWEVGGTVGIRWGRRGSSRGGFGAGWSGCGGRSAHHQRVSRAQEADVERGTCLPLETAGVEAREAGSGVVGLGEDVEGREGVGDGVARARREVGGAVVGHEGEGVEEALEGAGDLPGAEGGGRHGFGWGGRGPGAGSVVFGGMKWRWRAGW